MPTYQTSHPRWRQRRHALNKKSAVEAELLMEADEWLPKEEKAPQMGSPISVSSLFEFMPEVKPISLPGAWIVVDKRGKPLKPDPKMYDEPTKSRKKKKKSRVQKSEPVPETLIGVLADAPSTSSCLDTFERHTTSRAKFVTRQLTAKQWAHYRWEKEISKAVNLVQIETFEALENGASLADEPPTANMMRLAKLMTRHDPRGNNPKEKARRAARRAAASERCYFPGEDDEVWPAQPALLAKTVKATASVTKPESDKSTSPPPEDLGANPWFADFTSQATHKRLSPTVPFAKKARTSKGTSDKQAAMPKSTKQGSNQANAKKCLVM